jgi:hypothetical protein
MSADTDSLLAPNDDKAFEQLCQHVMEHRCRTLWGQAYARSGFPQHGVDFYIEVPAGSAKTHGAGMQIIGVQCKYKDRLIGHDLTVSELEIESKKAKLFNPRLTTFVLATSAPTSKAVQDRANELTRENKRKRPPLFHVTVWFWEKIRHEFAKDGQLLREITRRFYPHLRAAFSSTLNARVQLPAVPRHTIPRPDLMAKITEAFSIERPNGAIRAVALVADGGFGKSTAALQYANLSNGRYPGGRYLIRCEDADVVAEMAGLAPLDAVRQQSPEESAKEVKRRLETGPTCLLILDNVVGSEQWDSRPFRSLIPLGQTDVLVTTRARQLADVTEVQAGPLTLDESIRVLATFRSDAAAETNWPHAQSLAIEVEGLPVAVAAIGAYMKLTPKASWERFSSALRDGSADLTYGSDGRVASQLSYGRSVIDVLDAAINALPTAHRRAVEYAVLLPPDTVPESWLVGLLEADAELTLTAKPGVTVSPASIVVDELAELTLLRHTGEGELWVQMRTNDLHRAGVSRRVELGDFLDLGDYERSNSKVPLLGVHRVHRRRLMERLDNREVLIERIARFAKDLELRQQRAFIEGKIRRYSKLADNLPLDAATAFGNVEFLGFVSEPITDVGAALISNPATGCKALKDLNFHRPKMTDAGIIAIAAPDTALSSLNRLFIASTQAGDAAAMALAAKSSGLRNLRSLALIDSQLTDAGVAALAAEDSGLKSLRGLSLSSNRITADGVAALAASSTGLRNLKSLSLSPSVTDAMLIALAVPDSGLKDLTDLDLMVSQLTVLGLSALAAPNTGLGKLTSLNLAMNELTDLELSALAATNTGLGKLTSLNLAATKLTDVGAAALAHKDTGLTKLVHLNLNETMVTDAGVAAIRERLPNCQVRYSEHLRPWSDISLESGMRSKADVRQRLSLSET